jgi:hypothetical protein
LYTYTSPGASGSLNLPATTQITINVGAGGVSLQETGGSTYLTWDSISISVAGGQPGVAQTDSQTFTDYLGNTYYCGGGGGNGGSSRPTSGGNGGNAGVAGSEFTGGTGGGPDGGAGGIAGSAGGTGGIGSGGGGGGPGGDKTFAGNGGDGGVGGGGGGSGGSDSDMRPGNGGNGGICGGGGGGGAFGGNRGNGGAGLVVLEIITTPLPCFKEGSKILTDKGYVPIEELKKGDLVKTLLNGFVPVHAVGEREIYHPASTQRVKDQLYKLSSEDYPSIFEPLVLTGSHSILENNFVSEEQREKTRKLLGKIYVTDDKYRVPACLDKKASVFGEKGNYTIYHLALENDNYYENYGIYANGLLVESCSKRYLKELSNMIIHL